MQQTSSEQLLEQQTTERKVLQKKTGHVTDVVGSASSDSYSRKYQFFGSTEREQGGHFLQTQRVYYK